MDKNQPTEETRALVDRMDIALVELSTPIEPLIGDAVVNFNRIAEFITRPLQEAGVDREDRLRLVQRPLPHEGRYRREARSPPRPLA